MIPPTVSVPKVKEVASIFSKYSVSSEVSPQIIPQQKAIPNATLSSGFIPV